MARFVAGAVFFCFPIRPLMSQEVSIKKLKGLLMGSRRRREGMAGGHVLL